MKRLSVIAILFFYAATACAQNLAIGLFGGVSTYNGDLSTSNKPNSNTSNAVVGISFLNAVSDHFAVRAEFNYTVLSGNDKYNKDSAKIKRNLNFETSIAEVNLIGEYYILSKAEYTFSPYLMAGGGVFHFNPYTNIDGGKVFLKPLSTEGQGLLKYPQRKEYKLTQPAITLGGGFKYAATPRLELKLELSYRKLFTDYLDDVSTVYVDRNDLLIAKGQLAVGAAYRGDEIRYGSQVYPSKGEQRGSPKEKDSYYFIGFGVTYSLSEVLFSGGRGIKCPATP